MCFLSCDSTFRESELEKLSIIIGFNQSDTTYGWNGKTSGFTLHYLHFTDIIEEHGHSFPLSPGLIPIVYFQNIQKIFLGEPFTSCKPTKSVNNYTIWRSGIYRPFSFGPDDTSGWLGLVVDPVKGMISKTERRTKIFTRSVSVWQVRLWCRLLNIAPVTFHI